MYQDESATKTPNNRQKSGTQAQRPRGNSAATEEILNAYEVAGFHLVPLTPGGKKPVGNGWQIREIPRSEIEDNLRRGGGVGVQVGERSGWISAVDLDCDEARELAPRFLPDTLTSGKENERLPSHYVYISEGMGYRRFSDLGVGELIAIKASNNGRGHQFVVEPSVHETKGAYKWMGGFNPSKITRISSEDLERRVGRLAAASLIARCLPPGGRHHLAMCLAGYLLRHGEDIDGALELMRPAWELADAPHEGLRDLEGIVHDTQDRLDRGADRILGGGKLHELIPNLPSRLANYLGWGRPNMTDGTPKHYTHTDDGNALRFVDAYGELVRYCPTWKSWLVWDGQRWEKGAEGKVMRMARAVARGIHTDAAHVEDTDKQKAINRWAFQSQYQNRLNAMIALAKTDERVEISPDDFDSAPWLMTVDNGTLNLRTGQLQPHNPKDLITKLSPVPYNPYAQAPRFTRFLSEVFAGDEELIGFVRRFAGYTLTGSTEERCLAILHGAGKNGTSTLVELIRHVMGDYARGTAVETILAHRDGRAGNDVAALKGARFVSTSEIDKGKKLAESKVKQLTGSDTVTARFLFSEFFDFIPEFKLWVSTNNKPEIQGTENAIWDRIRLIPFGVRFEGANLDKDLLRKLRDEGAGVLAWMVRGCLEWQANGLGTAAKVTEATQEYRAEMDVLSAFISERCVEGANMSAPAKALYEEYTDWCFKNDEDADVQRTFGRNLTDRGYISFKYTSGPHKDRKGWKGVGLQADKGPGAPLLIRPDSDKPGGSSGGSSSAPADKAESSSAPESRLDKRNPEKPADERTKADKDSDSFEVGPPFIEKDSEVHPPSSALSASGVSEDEEDSEELPLSGHLQPGESAGMDELRRIREYVGQGFSEKWARKEVLGEGGEEANE